MLCGFFFFQAEDGIRDLVRSRGLGDVYKRQASLAQRGAKGEVLGHLSLVLLVGHARIGRWVHVDQQHVLHLSSPNI